MARTGNPTGMWIRRVAATVLVLGLAVGAAPAAAATGTSQGACDDATGVTVVVDASAVHGGVRVRCVPDAAGLTGLDALKAAGFEVTGTRRYGEAFVCRIDGRPSPTRELAIPGDEDYREACADTPPTTAMWAYFSGDGGEWTYSRFGAKSRTVEPGGFEGWSFTVGATEGSNPPAFEPAGHGVAAAAPKTSAAPAPETATPLPDSDGAARWVAAAVVVGLGALATGTAWRRRRNNP